MIIYKLTSSSELSKYNDIELYFDTIENAEKMIRKLLPQSEHSKIEENPNKRLNDFSHFYYEDETYELGYMYYLVETISIITEVED